MKQTRNIDFIAYVGNNIRRIRIEKNISQQQLAHKADLELSQINRIELGKINTSISQLYAIAGALGVNPKDFL